MNTIAPKKHTKIKTPHTGDTHLPEPPYLLAATFSLCLLLHELLLGERVSLLLILQLLELARWVAADERVGSVRRTHLEGHGATPSYTDKE